MSATVSPFDKMPDPENPAAKSDSSQPGASPQLPPRKHWRRRLVFSIVVLLLLLGGLAIFLPTLAGTSFVRGMVLARINRQLNGSVEIQNWSLSWTGGMRIDGIKVFDERKAEILSVAHLQTELSLLDAMRGRYHFGETSVDEPNLEQLIIYPDGSNNFQKLLKKTSADPAEPREPKTEPGPDDRKNQPKVSNSAKAVDVQGHFTVNRLRGYILDQRAGEPLIILPESSMSFRINSPQQPIENALVLVCRVGTNGTPGTIKIRGTAQTGVNATVDETLELASISLAALNPFLAMSGEKIALGGVANGAIEFKTGASTPFSAMGQITADHFTATDEATHVEIYSAEKINFAVRTAGDPTKAGTPVRVEASASVAHLKMAIAPTATTQPASPLQVTSGTASLKLSIARDTTGENTKFQDGQLTVNQLVLERGDSKYAPAQDAVSIQFAGEVNEAKGITALMLSVLNGNAFGSTIKMSEPLTVKSGGGAMNASGAIELAGKIAEVTSLLETLQGKARGNGYPYDGNYRLAEHVTTQGNVITLNGEVGIADFQVSDLDRKQPVFSEKQISLVNNISYDTGSKNLEITNLKCDMMGSDALHLNIAGAIQDVGERQAFDHMKLTLGYDLEKLWPIVYPMLSPQEQKDLKNAKVTGKFEKVFTLAGSYPAGKLFSEAVTSLKLNGAIAIGRFNGMGVDLAQLEIPLSLDGGMLRLIYADRPEGQQLPAAAYLNGGQLNLGGVTVNLKGKESRLTTPKDWKLITHATINPLLGDNLGKYINPVFTNSARARGLLDVSIAYCEGVALGAAMKTVDSGKAKILFSLHDMDIVNPLGSQMVGSLTKVIPANLLGLLGNVKGLNIPGGEASRDPSSSNIFQGEIQDAVVTLDQGVTTQDVTLQLGDAASKAQLATGQAGGPGNGGAIMPLHFSGDIHLADLRQNLQVTFPTELLARFIRVKGVGKTLADIFPAGIPLSLRGKTTKAEIDLGETGQRLIQGFTQSNLKSITGGKDEKGDDVLGGLLDALGGNKKKKDKKGD